MAIVDELVAILGYEIKGEANLKRFENNLNQSAKRVSTLTQKIVAYGAAADRAFDLSRKMAIPSGLALLYTKRIKDAALQTEGWAQGFKAVTGSVSEANDELAFAEERADRYGANLVKVTQNWLKFRAATNGTELSDQAREIFETFTAVSVTLGQTPDQLDGALKAVEQMVSKGKVQAEELRGQLGERVYGAFLKAAEAMGITTAELDKMLEQGQVVASDLLPKLAKQLQQDYNLNLGDSIDTDIATFARLENSLFKLRVAIAGSGFIDFLAKSAEGLTKLVEKIASAPPWVQKLAATMITLVAASAPLLWIFGAIARSISIVLKMALAFKSLAGALGAVAIARSGGKLISFLSFFRKNKSIITALKALRFGFAALTSPILVAVAALSAVGLALNDLWHFINGGESILGALADGLSNGDLSAFGERIGTNIVEGIFSVFHQIGQLADKFQALVNDPEFYRMGGEILGKIVDGLLAAVAVLGLSFAKVAAGIFWGIVNSLLGFDAKAAVTSFLTDLIEKIVKVWNNITAFYDIGVSMMSKLFEGMKSIGKKIKSWFVDLLPEWAKGSFSASAEIENGAQNLEGNLQKIDGKTGLTTGSVANVSNRASQKINNSINIEQNVQQPTNAPKQLAKATGAALSNVMPDRAQLQIEPSQP